MESCARQLIDILTESADDLIVVDVQPSLEKHFGVGYVDKVVRRINETTGSVLVYFVGPELGYQDTADSVLDYFIEYGLDQNASLEFVEKTYGWFRDAMELHSTAEIVNRVKIGLANDNWDLNDRLMPVGRPDDSVIESLPRYAGATLIGGQRGSCIDEIEILGQAMGLNFKTDESMVY